MSWNKGENENEILYKITFAINVSLCSVNLKKIQSSYKCLLPTAYGVWGRLCFCHSVHNWGGGGGLLPELLLEGGCLVWVGASGLRGVVWSWGVSGMGVGVWSERGRVRPSRDGYCRVRYASYWNPSCFGWSVADLHGKNLDAHLELSFLHFYAVFRKNWPNTWLPLPIWGWCPPSTNPVFGNRFANGTLLRVSLICLLLT